MNCALFHFVLRVGTLEAPYSLRYVVWSSPFVPYFTKALASRKDQHSPIEQDPNQPCEASNKLRSDYDIGHRGR